MLFNHSKTYIPAKKHYFCNLNKKLIYDGDVVSISLFGKNNNSARTKGRATRAIKRAIIPGYGRKGMGILHPKRAIYNKVYRRTTFSIFDLAKGSSSNSGCCVVIAFWVIATIALTACCISITRRLQMQNYAILFGHIKENM